MRLNPYNALSTPIEAICDCCGQLRMVRLYILQDGTAAWVCEPCRDPRQKI